ncbi:hypothetical protein BDR22DRAFT_841185 [Usnea florida]
MSLPNQPPAGAGQTGLEAVVHQVHDNLMANFNLHDYLNVRHLTQSTLHSLDEVDLSTQDLSNPTPGVPHRANSFLQRTLGAHCDDMRSTPTAAAVPNAPAPPQQMQCPNNPRRNIPMGPCDEPNPTTHPPFPTRCFNVCDDCRTSWHLYHTRQMTNALSSPVLHPLQTLQSPPPPPTPPAALRLRMQNHHPRGPGNATIVSRGWRRRRTPWATRAGGSSNGRTSEVGGGGWCMWMIGPAGLGGGRRARQGGVGGRRGLSTRGGGGEGSVSRIFRCMMRRVCVVGGRLGLEGSSGLFRFFSFFFAFACLFWFSFGPPQGGRRRGNMEV